MHKVSAPFAVLLLALAACSPANGRADIAREVAEAVAAAGDDGVVDLGSVAQFDWDALYVFPGETTDDQVNEAIGITWASGGSGSSLAPGDGLVLVVFLREGDVTSWSVLNAGNPAVAVRFDSSLYSQRIVKADAVFRSDLREPTISGRPIFVLMPPG